MSALSNAVECTSDVDAGKTPPQKSFGVTPQSQYRTLRNLVRDVQESYRAHLVPSAYEAPQTQVEGDLLMRTALLQDHHFVASEIECARVKRSATDHHEQISASQHTMNEVIDRCSSTGEMRSDRSPFNSGTDSRVSNARITASTRWFAMKKAKSQHVKRVD